MPPTARPWTTAESFPLGRPFGAIDDTPQPPSPSATRPFGLRFAVAPTKAATANLDTDRIQYDSRTQTALMADGGTLSPVFKHTSNNTSTSTGSHDRQGADSDSDKGGD